MVQKSCMSTFARHRILILLVCCIGCKRHAPPSSAPVYQIFPRVKSQFEQVFQESSDVLKKNTEAAAAAFTKAAPKLSRYDEAEFGYDKNGVYTNIGGSARSNVYVRRRAQLSHAELADIRRSETLEPIWQANQTAYPFVKWQYIMFSKELILRLWPWAELSHTYGPNLDFATLDSVMATFRQAPRAGAVLCQNPTQDYNGTGFISSCMKAFDVRGRRYGLCGVDIAWDWVFSDLFVYSDAQWNAICFVADSSGKVLYFSPAIKKNSVFWDKILEQQSVFDSLQVKADPSHPIAITLKSGRHYWIEKLSINDWYLGMAIWSHG